ncbi:MAG: alpha-hydroxy acid oxidase [Ignavibacteria bacterium]
MTPITISEFESLAKEKLSQMAYDYYSSGANDEITLRENCNAYKRIYLKYRVLVDVSKRDLTTEVMGNKISMPVMIAPTAFHKLAHDEGELAVAKAAGAAGTIMILSTLSNSAVEEVVKASSKPVWFQLYVFKDRVITKALIERAEAAGCKAIVLTVDAPLLGTRERDVRNRFNLPDGVTVKNLETVFKDKLLQKGDSGISSYVTEYFDASFNWKDIEWLKSITKLPLLIKGISCKEDALLSIEHGVNGIVVSNHGGRQLDTCKATIDVLPEIADAVQGKIEILIDGGIRRGTDILKAIALGAKAVLVGRPIIWGLAAHGENGVKDVLEIFRKEFDLSMALCGCDSIKKITKNLIA